MSSQPTVHGSIVIEHYITCPHCHYYIDEVDDDEWWKKTIGDDFPNSEAYKDQYEAQCPKCEQPFIVDGFQY
jgi:Zn finger protein HypA/HybF involved in hydrogenase expression